MHIAGFLKLPSSRDRATRQRKMGQWEAASWDIKQRGKERRLARVGGLCDGELGKRRNQSVKHVFRKSNG